MSDETRLQDNQNDTDTRLVDSTKQAAYYVPDTETEESKKSSTMKILIWSTVGVVALLAVIGVIYFFWPSDQGIDKDVEAAAVESSDEDAPGYRASNAAVKLLEDAQ